MRKPFILGLAALAVGLGVVASPFAGATARGGKTLVFIEKEISSTEIDLGDPGFSAGNRFVFVNKLLDEDGRAVGRDGGACEILNISGRSVMTQCIVTAQLAGGDLTVQGIVDFGGPADFVVAITGGTGRYAGAKGTVDGKDLGNG